MSRTISLTDAQVYSVHMACLNRFAVIRDTLLPNFSVLADPQYAKVEQKYRDEIPALNDVLVMLGGEHARQDTAFLDD